MLNAFEFVLLPAKKNEAPVKPERIINPAHATG